MREWIEDGTPESQFSQAKSWRDEQKFMADLAQRVKDRMSQAGVSIEGEGGEAMQNAVAPVALWTEVSADNAEAQAQRMESQGEAFKKVQTSIPKKGEEQHPPEDHWLESVGSSLGIANTDNENAKAHNEKLRQEAVTAFQGYDNTSQNNVQSSAVFTAPPEAGKNPVVASGPQPPQAGGVDTGGMSSDSTQSASAGGGSAGGAAGGGAVGGGAGGGAGGHSPGSSSPSGTAPSSSAPAGHQPWQRGTLEPPRGGPQGGAGGFAGAMPGGGSAGGGAAGGGRAGGASGSGSGSGSGGRAGGGAGGRGALGPGGSAGSGGGAAGGQTGASSGGATGGRGGAGGAGMGGAGARGAGSQGEEDEEHYSPEFLKGDYGFFDEDVPRVAPPVFGENR